MRDEDKRFATIYRPVALCRFCFWDSQLPGGTWALIRSCRDYRGVSLSAVDKISSTVSLFGARGYGYPFRSIAWVNWFETLLELTEGPPPEIETKFQPAVPEKTGLSL